MTVDEAEAMDRAGAFGEGSMAPKVRAAAEFARDTGGRAIIAQLGSRAGGGAGRGRNDDHAREHVNMHEYQARDAAPAPARRADRPGEVATTPDEAEAIARKIGGTVVVKAQVHAGGRGKAGGVKLAEDAGGGRGRGGRRSSA